MKRRKSSGAYRKEKMIMIASTILVLTAMTVTGIYIYNSNQSSEPENNVVDFSSLENSGREKSSQVAEAENKSAKNLTSGQQDSGELDYDPFYEEADRKLNSEEVNAGAQKAEEDTQPAQEENTDASKSVGYAEIGGTNLDGNDVAGEAEAADANAAEAADFPDADEGAVAEGEDPEAEGQAMEAVADVTKEAVNLHFSEENRLEWPIVGNVLLNYSMDKTVYFATLQQYKYNPSIVIGATQGTNVACAANAIVESIYKDPQTGTTIQMNLGDGYALTYGQLQEVMVEEGDYVETGAFIGKVAAPTKYYTAEGTNVYFKLTKDGEPVNPLNYLG